VSHSIIPVSSPAPRHAGVVFFLHWVRGAVWIQIEDPSLTTLFMHSTGNQRSNCDPVIARFLYRLRQLCVFFWCPFTHVLFIGRIQIADQTSTALLTRSTGGNQRSNCDPAFFAIFLYHFGQLCASLGHRNREGDVSATARVAPNSHASRHFFLPRIV
jgi:hypothetical protein